MATQGNKYLATPCEQKLLEVLCKPNSLGKSITDICGEAGVDRGVYYDAIKKEGFFEYRNQLLMDIIKTNVGDIIQATLKYGRDNPKNSKDREMILKMAGIYEDIL